MYRPQRTFRGQRPAAATVLWLAAAVALATGIWSWSAGVGLAPAALLVAAALLLANIAGQVGALTVDGGTMSWREGWRRRTVPIAEVVDVRGVVSRAGWYATRVAHLMVVTPRRDHLVPSFHFGARPDTLTEVETAAAEIRAFLWPRGTLRPDPDTVVRLVAPLGNASLRADPLALSIRHRGATRTFPMTEVVEYVALPQPTGDVALAARVVDEHAEAGTHDELLAGFTAPRSELEPMLTTLQHHLAGVRRRSMRGH